MFLTTRNADFVNLGSRINRMLNDTLGSLDWQVRDSAAAAWMPPVDVLEEADAIRIIAEVPGVKPEDVKISVENNAHDPGHEGAGRRGAHRARAPL